MNDSALENVDWREEYEFNKNHSQLEQIISVGDNDIDMLTKYEIYARYVMRNISRFGERVGSSRVIGSRTIKNVCFAHSGDKKVDGTAIMRTIERLATDEVFVNRDVSPMRLYVPRETINTIREIKREKNKDIRQRMLDSFDNEAIADD